MGTSCPFDGKDDTDRRGKGRKNEPREFLLSPRKHGGNEALAHRAVRSKGRSMERKMRLDDERKFPIALGRRNGGSDVT